MSNVPLDPVPPDGTVKQDLPPGLGDLVGALADGTITAEQQAELAEVLRSSQIARQYYSDYLDLHAELYAHHGGMICGVPEVLTGAARPQEPKRLWRPFLLAFGAMVAAAVLVLMLQPAQEPPGGSSPLPVARLAQITDAADAEWSVPLTVGDDFPRETVQLTAGMAELGFGSGATMLVSAPAELRVLSDNAVELQRGTVYLRVPKAAIGFRVNTAAGSVIDLGTEFGVRVADDGGLETHVVKGLVRMLTADETQAVPIAAGEARSLHPLAPAEIRKVVFAGERFPTVLPQGTAGMPDGIRWEMLPTDNGVVYAKRPDGSVAYTAKLMPTAATGPSWQLTEVGSAMYFDGKDDYLQTDFLGVGDGAPRTVAFWAKVPADATTRANVVPMISWGSFERDGGVWQISWNNNPGDGEVGGLRIGAWRGQVVARTDLRDGKWHHLAVVMNGKDMATGISLYVDGRLEETAMHNVEIRTLLIENMRIGRSIENQHCFRGWLADVQVYEGALNAEQVAKAAREGRRLQEQ